MAGLEEIPVVDVQIDNIQELWPTLLLAVRTSAFVAIDAELSGLGNRRKLNAKDLNDRYAALVNISQTRSVISVGLSCFRQQPAGEQRGADLPTPSPTPGGPRYVCQTFNILVLCSEEYVVEPGSLQFLVNHNFDFNRQYAKGIPYHRGPDQAKPKQRQWFRELLAEVSTHKIPVVFHNAFVDLGFLYQSFHTTMPVSIGPFLADLTELFPGGVYDTKYITEFKARFPASYLEYVFRKCFEYFDQYDHYAACWVTLRGDIIIGRVQKIAVENKAGLLSASMYSQRDNQEISDAGRAAISISTLTYPKTCAYITHLPCNIINATHTQDQELCQTYAAHGWCGAGPRCPKSHDIGQILDADDKGSKSKKKRRKRKAKSDLTLTDPDVTADPDTADMDSTSAETDTNPSMTSDMATIDLDSVAADKNSSIVDEDDTSPAAVSPDDTPSPVPADNIPSQAGGDTNEQEGMEVPSDNEPPKSASNGEAKPQPTKPNRSRTEGHRAGFDSFMTGFIFACFAHNFGEKGELGMLDYANKVAMSGKDIPLRIVQGNFVKTSKEHRLKMDKVASMVT